MGKTKNGSFISDELSVGKQVTYQKYKWPTPNGEKILSVEYHPSFHDVDESTIEFECRHGSNIRFILRTKKEETIASTISRVFRVPKKRLKLVAKGKRIEHKDAAEFARKGVVLFFVGSPVTEEQIAIQKQKKKEKALLEEKKRLQKEEEKRIMEQKKQEEEEWINMEMKKLEERKKKVIQKQKQKEKSICKSITKFCTS